MSRAESDVAQSVAEKSAEAMWRRDDASRFIGITLQSVGPGCAVMQMVVENHHTNGHDICHGGYIFTLADSAFAFACNSYNQIAVAQSNTIHYHRPARAGDLLTAAAREIVRSRRSGLYDVAVTDQQGQLIASFRGASRTIEGKHF